MTVLFARTGNTVASKTNPSEMLLGIGRSVAGATHDLTMFREDGLDLGPITKSIKNSKTPYKEKFIIRMDLGYLGIAEELPGVITKMNKKKPKNRDLTDQELENNRYTDTHKFVPVIDQQIILY